MSLYLRCVCGLSLRLQPIMTDIIEAAAMRCRTMSDGSLRIEVEVSPVDAQAAFGLFGRPGAPMAIAALHPGYRAVVEPAPVLPTPEPKKQRKLTPGHELSREAAMLCANWKFLEWARTVTAEKIASPGDGAIWMRRYCHVDSRTEFDTSPAAAERFIQRVRLPFVRWSNAQQKKQE